MKRLLVPLRGVVRTGAFVARREAAATPLSEERSGARGDSVTSNPGYGSCVSPPPGSEDPCRRGLLARAGSRGRFCRGSPHTFCRM